MAALRTEKLHFDLAVTSPDLLEVRIQFILSGKPFFDRDDGAVLQFLFLYDHDLTCRVLLGLNGEEG